MQSICCRRLRAAAIPKNLDAILEKFAISKREAEVNNRPQLLLRIQQEEKKLK